MFSASSAPHRALGTRRGEVGEEDTKLAAQGQILAAIFPQERNGKVN